MGKQRNSQKIYMQVQTLNAWIARVQEGSKRDPWILKVGWRSKPRVNQDIAYAGPYSLRNYLGYEE